MGLDYYVARFYDPTLGRFVQADTVVPDGVQGYDRYAYVGNSPINHTDPTGHRTCTDDGYCPLGTGSSSSAGNKDSANERDKQGHSNVLSTSDGTAGSTPQWNTSSLLRFAIQARPMDSESDFWLDYATPAGTPASPGKTPEYSAVPVAPTLTPELWNVHVQIPPTAAREPYRFPEPPDSIDPDKACVFCAPSAPKVDQIWVGVGGPFNAVRRLLR